MLLYVLTITLDPLLSTQDLGLGVYEERKKGAEAEADYDMSSSSSEDSDTDSTASDESDEIIINSFQPARPIKGLPRRASSKNTSADVHQKPQIVVLGDSTSGSEDDKDMSMAK
jgi:hypothetical protein